MKSSAGCAMCSRPPHRRNTRDRSPMELLPAENDKYPTTARATDESERDEAHIIVFREFLNARASIEERNAGSEARASRPDHAGLLDSSHTFKSEGVNADVEADNMFKIDDKRRRRRRKHNRCFLIKTRASSGVPGVVWFALNTRIL